MFQIGNIPGIEALCISCTENALQARKFLEACKSSTEILNKIFDNITNIFSTDIDVDDNQALYLTIEDLEADVIIVNNDPNEINAEEYEFECRECNNYFETYMKLNAHNLKYHGNFTCEQCFDVFPSHPELRVHITSKHTFKCPECPQFLNSEESLRKHQNRVHNIHVCKECGKSFRGLDKLHIHESKHATKNTCPKCGKMYTTKEYYVRHVKLCLVDKIDPHPVRSDYERNYTCEKCEKSYSTPGGLRVHIRFAHENAKPHVCPECGKEFTAPSYLKIHMIKHSGEKNFKCDICNNRFVTKEALLYHTRRHTGEKPYSCKICHETFVNASARAEHIKFRHVGPTLMCEICSRKFVTSHFLKQHISRHHDPSSKLYYGRNMIPPNMPGEQNMRIKVEIKN